MKHIESDNEKSGGPYTEAFTSIWMHWKFTSLVKALGERPKVVFGMLHLLWHSQVSSNETGELRGWDADRLAAVMDWDGPPDVLAAAMIKAEWLARLADETPGYQMAKWQSYGGQFLAVRAGWRKKKQDMVAASKKSKELPETSHGVPPEVSGNLSISKAKLIKADQTKADQTLQSESEPAPPAVVKTIQPTLSVATPKGPRWKPGLLDEDRKALEPKTVAEYLARAYDYPHHPATDGQKTFGDVLRADPVVTAAYGPDRGMTLEAALESTGWGHWQAQDEMGRDRWIWPASAPRRIEGWLRDAAAKAAEVATRSKLTHARAEASGIDLAKPLAAKADPAREELRKVWRLRHGKGQDLAPCATWIDDVLTRGTSAAEMEWFRGATLMPTTPAPAGPPVDADARRASKAAYDRFVETVPPQDRAAGLPQWREWVDAGSPPRWTGPLRQGSGGQPRQPPTGSAANQPPAGDPDEVDDAAITDAKAKLAALSSGIARPKPKAKLALMPSREALDRMLPADLTTDGGAR